MEDNKIPSLNDMSLLSSRLSLISRFNHCVGSPVPEAQRVQNEFINGFMDPQLISAFVAEYEMIIESRRASLNAARP